MRVYMCTLCMHEYMFRQKGETAWRLLYNDGDDGYEMMIFNRKFRRPLPSTLHTAQLYRVFPIILNT